MDYYVYLILGAVAGGLINGLVGSGTSMFALIFWLQIMPPVQAVSLTVVISVTSGLQGVWLVRHAIKDQPVRLARFLLPAILGIPIGVGTLAIIEPSFLKLAIATALILYGVFFASRRSLPQLARNTPVVDAIVGFLGGVLGGAASLSGVLPTMWCALRPWPKNETRAVLQPFNVAVLSLTAVLLVFKGVYSWESVRLLAFVLPVTIICAQIGITIFKRLTDAQFRRLIIVLMFVSGTVLLIREIV